MKDAKDLLPWAVTDISIRPYEGYWSMNPSLHYDGQTWRCVLRCTDYAMPNGRTIRSSKSRPAGNQTKNAMVIFDPKTWKPIQIYKMHERDDHPRTPCANIGYEDMRIFRTDRGGLQGIAASLHLKREKSPAAGGSHHQPPEQVLLSFDGNYDIVAAEPIRGDWWSGSPQKNWVPFDDCAEPRFLYSIAKGTLFDDHGALHGDAAVVRPSAAAAPLPSSSPPGAPSPARQPSEQEIAEARRREDREREDRDRQERESREEKERKKKCDRDSHPTGHRDPRTQLSTGGASAVMVRGRRLSHDTITSRPAGTSVRSHSTRVSTESSTRAFGAGRALMPRYEGLRGGTQLVRVADDSWLGIGHQMQYVQSKKYYWHTFYLVDARGKMKAASPPCKLASNGIEFAAGMAIDGDRVVVSFGVDDMECKIGETRLSAVMELLAPVER